MNSLTPTLHLTPRRAALRTGVPNEVDLLVRIEAPPRPVEAGGSRPALNLALVIDRSGSMSGPPLREAKRCAEWVVDRLGSQDRAAVVAYDHGVNVVVPSRDVRDRGDIRRAIASIHEGGMTNLHGGWLAGADQIATACENGALSRVILLSDGCANRGETDPQTITEQARALAAEGVTTSTYGLGNHFNELLMTAMAEAGGGSAYYGDSADDLFEPFEQEFDLLAATFGRRVTLRVAGLTGAEWQLVNDYPAAGPGLAGVWRLPDLAYEAEVWALLRLNMPASQETLVELLEVSAEYTDLDGRRCELSAGRLSLPVVPADVWEDYAEDETVARRADELAAAALQSQARAAALAGDWDQVDQILGAARRVGQRSPWASEIVTELQGLAAERDRLRFSKEAHYADRRMRYQHRSPRADSLSPLDDADAPSYLRRKPRQGRRSGRKGKR